ncbi:hypothetical protein [Nocardioides astragali]|jgi:hypothetical protein|uniref:Uncharacterized protein n=1 Tax=Nocardioides astragali TaxID=1776736 RepID=A0ABW2N4H9_9ACTN|nr:hypothetical protein [Nocardioides astragali]
MSKEELPPMPTPFTQEPELVPGGVDALPDDPADNGLGRDLDPDDNPAVDDVLPDAVSEPDDKPQAPEGKADDAEAGATTEDQDAGQEAEDGSVEPPA